MRNPELDELASKGYRFQISSNGYQVWHKDQYLGGASSLHLHLRGWRAKQADLLMHIGTVISLCNANEAKLKPNLDQDYMVWLGIVNVLAYMGWKCVCGYVFKDTEGKLHELNPSNFGYDIGKVVNEKPD